MSMTDQTSDQKRLVAFLCTPSVYGMTEDSTIEHVETHASHVFLAGDYAIKMKKPVRFPYLDFSTPAKRLEACRNELAVNRQFTTANLYRSLGAVLKQGDDYRLSLNLNEADNFGQENVVEPLVVMNRFDREQQLDNIAARGELTPSLADRLGVMAARAVARAAPRDLDWPSAFRSSIKESIAELRADQGLFDPAHIDSVDQKFAAFLRDDHSALLHRAEGNRIRRCHGDLHLRNIALFDGEPSPFDALEFDDDLASTDVLYDLAFLMMDLIHRDLADAAARVASITVAAESDFGAAGLIPAYIAARALIRAKVAAAKASQSTSDEAEKARDDARRYFQLAGEMLEDAAPGLIAVGGLSGVGKSTLAFDLARRMQAKPLVIRSDVIRKQLARVDLFDRAPAGAYRPSITERVYARLTTACKAALESGASVIVDATFSDPARRADAEKPAKEAGVPFFGLWLHAETGERVQRIKGRITDISDADEQVARKQQEPSEELDDWSTIDAGQGREKVCRYATQIIEGDGYGGET